MGVRGVVWIVLCFLAFANLRVSAQAIESREVTTPVVPACGLSCIATHLPSSGCALADITCQCRSHSFGLAVSKCVLVECNMDDMVTFAKINAHTCKLSHESRSREVYMTAGISYGIGVLFVALRTWSKLSNNRLSFTDWICLVALLVSGGSTGCVIKMTSIGFGEHLWNLEEGQNLRDILLYFWVSATTYVLILGAIKASLVFLYIEIFPERKTRIAAYVILGIIVTNTVVVYSCATFMCSPIRGFWNLDLHAKCISINAIGYATSGSSIGQDLILLVFPLVCIRKLKMKRRRKIVVSLMFILGTFGCITTILRLHTLLRFKKTIDPTWDYVGATTWAMLELASGFVCISLPSIRVLFMHILPKKLRGNTSYNSKSAPQSSRKATDKSLKDGSWMNITGGGIKTNISASPTSKLWPSASQRGSHQRLGSSRSSNPGIVISPPGVAPLEQVEMKNMRNSFYEHSTSPPAIGILPDEGFDQAYFDAHKRRMGN